jgi:hypothetical protein
MEKEPNPTAYGIRLEVLRMAHNDCFELFQHKLNALENSKPVLENGTGVTRFFPVSETEINGLYPTTGQILDRAKQLYKFICDKAN